MDLLIIAGQRFTLLPSAPEAPSSLAAAYQPFFSPADSRLDSAAIYTIFPADRPRLPPIEGTPDWANEIWRMGPGGDGLCIEIYDVMRSRWVPVACVARDFSTGEIQPFHGRRAAPSPYALNYPYDQAILINRLLQRHVLIVHGSAVIVEGKGYVFFGPSGIGKTTISRLWRDRGAILLNDDRVALYQEPDGTWKVAGTPWHGEEPIVSPASAPLAGVARLRQSPTFSLRSTDNATGLSELIACALIPFFQREGIHHALALLERLLDAVPLLEFSFTPDQEALSRFLDSMHSGRA